MRSQGLGKRKKRGEAQAWDSAFRGLESESLGFWLLLVVNLNSNYYPELKHWRREKQVAQTVSY